MFELIEKQDRIEGQQALAGGELVLPGVEDDPAMQHARDFAERRV